MLPSWIIEEIKKRERERLRPDERPRGELPLPEPGKPPGPYSPAAHPDE